MMIKYLEIYKQHLIVEKGLAMNSVNSYISDIYDYFKYDEEGDINGYLKYLSEKYELYVLTNYFKEPQIGRLKKAKIYEYFSKIIGGDDALIKPHKEIFMLACEGIDPSEATMVGDHIMRDIQGGKDAGLKVIQIDYLNKYEDNNDHPLIREFKQLKDLL